jgi:molybdopterin/thiamine biosynthesis adenylyltransferase
MFSDDEVERYARHLVLREIGGPGQQKLKAAKVLAVGAGGLGGPAALYLAAAGVGTLGLVDADHVSLSNLQRQILFSTPDVGSSKTDIGAQHLAALNPEVQLVSHPFALAADNAEALIGQYDLVLDGVDDFAVRYLINAACLATGKALVSGAIGRWTGQVAVFHGQSCYRCLVPEIPPGAEACSAVGVVGALAGIIGSMMALEAIKEITGAGETLASRLFVYDGLSAEARTVRLSPDPDCPTCGTGAAG